MPLNKQLVDIVFDKGLNNKTSDHFTLNGNLKELENRVFNKIGRLDKRYGFSVLSNSAITDTDTSDIVNMNALSKFGEDELVLFADNNLYSYLPSINSWRYKDEALSAATVLDSIINGVSQQEDIDSCHANGISLFVWTDLSSGDILGCTYDIESKTVIQNNISITTTGDSPRCLTLGNNLFVFYCDGTDLKYKYLSINSPTTINSGTISTGLENVHSDHLYDVSNIGNVGYIFYKGTTATTVQQLSFNTAAEVLSDATIAATVTGCLTLKCINAADGFSYLAIGYRQTASLIKCAIYTPTMVVKKAISTLDSTASTTIVAMTIGYSSDTDKLVYFYQTNGASTSKTYVTANTLGVASGTIGTPAVFLRSVGIASKAFTVDDTIYINVLHESTLQSTVFTVNYTTGSVVCSFAKGRSGSLAIMWAPPSVNDVGNNKYQFAINVKGVIRSENATLFSLLGLSNATIDFEGPYTYNSVSINNNMLAVGGNVLCYDGISVVEQGFHLYPEGISQTATATLGGNISNGAYQYCALYSWVDAKGNVHKSAPSVPISYTASGGTSTQTITITVPTLRITQKYGDRGACTIELYRTEASGSIFYKVTSIASPTLNSISTDTVAIVDTLADASIISNEILYTTGSVLENLGAPSASIITTYKNRVFLAGLENPNEIRYSKIVRQYEGVAFNDALSIQCDPRGGDITALNQLDDKLIVFKNTSLSAIAGDGPTDVGVDQTYSEPELISTDVGCTDGNSVVLGPDGLFFKSAKGIYLLTRSLQLVYIGAEVEDYNNLSITSSVLLDDKNEIRFSTDSSVILVYNYFFKQWSIFTGHVIDDAVTYGDAYTAISDTDQLYFEPGNTYKDDGAYVNSKISTGWIGIHGIQGFQRAYRLTVLGYLRSAHWLKISIYTDYSDTLVQEKLFDVSTIMSLSQEYYGDGTYGDAVYGGEDNGVYQFQIHMKRQKCQAIRVVIEEIYDNSSDGSGQGMDITGITLEMGIKQGQNKLKGSKST